MERDKKIHTQSTGKEENRVGNIQPDGEVKITIQVQELILQRIMFPVQQD